METHSEPMEQDHSGPVVSSSSALMVSGLIYMDQAAEVILPAWACDGKRVHGHAGKPLRIPGMRDPVKDKLTDV